MTSAPCSPWALIAPSRRLLRLPARLVDPCRLARQVNQVAWLESGSGERADPCRLARQVNEVEWLRRPTTSALTSQPHSPVRQAHRGLLPSSPLPSNLSTSFTCEASAQGSKEAGADLPATGSQFRCLRLALRIEHSVIVIRNVDRAVRFRVPDSQYGFPGLEVPQCGGVAVTVLQRGPPLL